VFDLLQACLNGDRREPHVPATAASLASAAQEAARQGAVEFHIHPRDASGAETLAPSHVGAALLAIRDAVPGALVGIGSGTWIAPGGRARHADIKAWTVLPDYVSVNFNEEDAPEVIELLAKKGVQHEAGIWSIEDAERFLSLPASDHCKRVLVEMPDEPASTALARANAVMRRLSERKDLPPILLHGIDESCWPCLVKAFQLGLKSRVGFEDTLLLPDGTAASDNAALVRAAMTVTA